MWPWIVAGAVLLVVGALVVRFVRGMGKRYGALFAAAHVVEVAEAVPALKQAALTHIDEKLTPDDARGFTSNAGLVVLYSVQRDDGRFVHHVSVGLRAGYTANAVGGSFALLVLELLGLPLDQVEVGVEPSSVHHVEVVLDKAAHNALRNAPVGRVAAADAEARLKVAMEARARFAWRPRLAPRTRRPS